MTTAATYLIESLAASASFRTWLGISGSDAAALAAARARCHEAIVSEPTRPYALVVDDVDLSAERTGFAVSDVFRQQGMMHLWMEDALSNIDPDGTASDESVLAAFMLHAAATIRDVLAVSGQGGYLSIQSLRTMQRPAFGPSDADSRVVMVGYEITWD